MELVQQAAPGTLDDHEGQPAGEQAPEKVEYTSDEMKVFTPTSDIDMDRVPETFRPVIENMTRDYKALQTDHTKKSQRLAELEKAPPEPEVYFPENTQKDSVFKDYLKAPGKVLSDINSEIARLEAVIPDDGTEEYRAARRSIAYWTGVKDEFTEKRLEVTESRRNRDLAEAHVNSELGEDAAALKEFATKELGFTERDFIGKPSLREAAKKAYAIVNAEKIAKGKEVKPGPQKTVKPSGEAGERGGSQVLEEENPNLTTAERIEAMRKRRGNAG